VVQLRQLAVVDQAVEALHSGARQGQLRCIFGWRAARTWLQSGLVLGRPDTVVLRIAKLEEARIGEVGFGEVAW
jgi:hypothetical protein